MNAREAVSGKVRGLDRLRELKALLAAENPDLVFEVPEYDVVGLEGFAALEQIDFRRQVAEVMPPGEAPIIDAWPEAIRTAVDPLIEKWRGQHIIIRSSSQQEDGPHSFSGIYESETVECADEASVYAAVAKVYGSFCSQKAIKHREEQDLDDAMELIVEAYVADADYYGTMYTTYPTDSKLRSIEFSPEPMAVSENRASHAVDFYKEDGTLAFFDENLTVSQHPWLETLKRIGAAIEDLDGFSTLEWAVKGDRFYLLQKGDITDVDHTEITLPELDPTTILATTNVARGVGKHTYPVVQMREYEPPDIPPEAFATHGLDALSVGPDQWLAKIRRLDAQYPDGYILVVDHWFDTLFNMQMQLGKTTGDAQSFDDLTPNKRLIITHDSQSVSSHAFTVARTKGIGVVCLPADQSVLEVSDGQEVSVYFTGKKATVVDEGQQIEPQVDYRTIFVENLYIIGETQMFIENAERSAYQDFARYLLQYLQEKVSADWQAGISDRVMNAVYYNVHTGQRFYLSASSNVARRIVEGTVRVDFPASFIPIERESDDELPAALQGENPLDDMTLRGIFLGLQRYHKNPEDPRFDDPDWYRE